MGVGLDLIISPEPTKPAVLRTLHIVIGEGEVGLPAFSLNPAFSVNLSPSILPQLNNQEERRVTPIGRDPGGGGYSGTTAT